MKLDCVTIILDGMRFLPTQFAMLQKVGFDWHWHIAEGVAENVKDTAWCKKIAPRLSRDGTTEFLKELSRHPRITVYQKPLWHGKTEMFNTMLSGIGRTTHLLQMDADEIWTNEQLYLITELFRYTPNIQCARFACRYFVGPNLVTVGDDCYGNNAGEWLRAWRFNPGQRFITHEPPVLSGCADKSGTSFTRSMAREYGLTFDHYAYAFEDQVRFKEEYYGYENAVQHWTELQEYRGPFPVKLKQFLPWVDDRVLADRVYAA